MSVSWAADPDSKRACGHRRCKRTGRAGGVLVLAALAVIFGGAAAVPGRAAAAVAAAFSVFAAGVALLCWPHPRTSLGDLEALIEATREMTPRPRLDWTAAEWAARERELSEL